MVIPGFFNSSKSVVVMVRFLKKHPQYYSLYLVVGLILFVVVWFANKGASTQHNYTTSTHDSSSSVSQHSSFTPNATNVTSSTTQQLDALRARVASAPEDTMHVIRLARMLNNAHQSDEAISYYSEYLALHPKNRQAWLDFAQILSELKQWNEAEKATESLLQNYPSDPSGLYNLGAIYANQGRIEEARQIWTQLSGQSTDPSIVEMARSSNERLNAFLKP